MERLSVAAWQVSEMKFIKTTYLERVNLTGQVSNFVNDLLTNISP